MPDLGAATQRAIELGRAAADSPDDLELAIKAKLAVYTGFAEHMGGDQVFGPLVGALLAVLDRHKRNPVLDRPPYCDECVGGYEGVSGWPCMTVVDIAAQLGIEVADA